MQEIVERTLNLEKVGNTNTALKTHGLLTAVHEKIRVIATADPNQILRTNGSNDEPVVPARHTVERLINMFRILRRCGLDVLSAKELAAVLETSLRVASVFETIRTFEPGARTAADAPHNAEQVVSQTDTVAQAAYQTLGIIIAKTFCLGEYFNGQVDGAGDHFTRLMNISQEAKETLSDLQRLARYEVSNKFGEAFDLEAKRHDRAAWGWTAGTIVFAACGVGYLARSLQLLQYQIVQLPAAKLFAMETGHFAIISFVFFLMIFCSRNAASHRHNEVLNVQRRNALRSVNIVVDAAPTDAFKDSILIQAAYSAYESQSTGFGTGKK